MCIALHASFLSSVAIILYLFYIFDYYFMNFYKINKSLLLSIIYDAIKYFISFFTPLYYYFLIFQKINKILVHSMRQINTLFLSFLFLYYYFISFRKSMNY